MTPCEETLKQRETHIAELQARLDREYALSERLKAQVAGLKSEISCMDTANCAVATHVMRVCCADRCSDEEREQSKAYLRVAFS
jgi:predicted RNase H-like nuclease (RuvC/YqgF family)